MFDHLDDPQPLRADTTIRRAVSDRSRALRHQRQFVTAATALALIVASVGVAFAVTRPPAKRAVVVATETPSTTTTVPVGPTVACAALAATNGTQRATATLGTFSASLVGKPVTDPIGSAVLKDATVSISDGGQVVRTDVIVAPDDPTTPRPPEVIAAALQGPGDGTPLCLARFAGADRPVVLLGLYTGGADCCMYVRVIPVTEDRSFEFGFGRNGAALEAGPEGAVITSGDNSFNCVFTSCATSGAPAQVFEVQDGSFVNTTRQHPDLVAADAARWLALVDDPKQDDVRGFLAGWVGDQCLVGKGPYAFSQVDELNRQGRLKGSPPDMWPQGDAYVSALKKLLAVEKYC